MAQRKLASVQYVHRITPIEGADQIGRNKEGIVIRPITPEYSPITGGPLSMKVINNDYLLK